METHSGSVWMENIGQIVLSDNDGEYFWILPEMLLCNMKDYCISSPSFTFDDEEWNLVFTPGYNYDGFILNYCSINLYLWMKDYNTAKESYTVHLICKDETEKEIVSVEGETVNGGFHRRPFIDKIKLQLFSRNGRVKIICRMKEKEQTCNITEMISDNEDDKDKKKIKKSEDKDDKQKNVSILKGVDRLIENFRSILNDEQSSDVVLKTNYHEFHAHSIILRARCPVFASMFQHDMTEKQTGEVDISDCSTLAFRVFLQFLYTGSADTMSSENVVDLYYIADKNQVDDLKSDCVEFMKNALSVHNFCDVMALSLRHNEPELQKFATKFFSRNIKNIVKTVQWQKYISDYPVQANELYIKAFNI